MMKQMLRFRVVLLAIPPNGFFAFLPKNSWTLFGSVRFGSARQAEETNGIAGKTGCRVIKSKWNPHGPLRVSSITSTPTSSKPTADCETRSGAQLECQSRNRRRGVESMVACQCTKGASRPEQTGTHLQRRGWFAQARLAH